MITWKPLGGRSTGSDENSNELPGIRGVRQIFVPSLVPNRYIHFAWLRESFCVRDFLGDRQMRQSMGQPSDLKASDVWKKKQGPVYAIRHNITDINFWKKKLQAITQEAGVTGKGEELA